MTERAIKAILECWYLWLDEQKLYENTYAEYSNLYERDLAIKYAAICAGMEGPKLFINNIAFILTAVIAIFGMLSGVIPANIKEDFIHYGTEYGSYMLAFFIMFFLMDQLSVQVYVFKKCVIEDIVKERAREQAREKIFIVKIKRID